MSPDQVAATDPVAETGRQSPDPKKKLLKLTHGMAGVAGFLIGFVWASGFFMDMSSGPDWIMVGIVTLSSIGLALWLKFQAERLAKEFDEATDPPKDNCDQCGAVVEETMTFCVDCSENL